MPEEVIENSMFFEGGAYYGQEQFARFLKDIGGHNGVVHGIGDELQVVANDPANMAVKVKKGRSWVNGYIHEILKDPVQLVIDEADPSNDRIDRVVLHLNTTNPRGIAVLVLKGTAGSGQPPALTQTATVWEEPLYQVRVPAHALTISQECITDEREYMWYSRVNQPIASKTEIGSVKVGDGISVTADGTISMPYTPFPMMARMYTTDQGLGTLIVENVYNGTFGQKPIGTTLQNEGGATDAKSIDCMYHVHNSNNTGPGYEYTYVVTAWNCLTGTSRELYRESAHVDRSAHHYFYATVQCALEEIIDHEATGTYCHYDGDTIEGNTVYIGRPIT